MLASDDAWAIALTWREQLHNHVRLETSRGDSSHAIIKSYAWVRFHISSEDRHQVSAARAAAVAWFTLSCCRGYSGQENPVFWKRVFSELWQTLIDTNGGKTVDHLDVQSITDADGFFDQDGCGFPRFRLAIRQLHDQSVEASVRLFCGVPGEQLEPADRYKLEHVLGRLQPFIDTKRIKRGPAVSLACLVAYGLDTPHPDWHRLRVGPALMKILDQVNTASYPASPSLEPRFRIEEISFPTVLVLYNIADVRQLETLFQKYDIEIDISDCVIQPSVSVRGRAAITRSLLRLPGSGSVATSTTLHLSAGNASMLPAFASALPYTTSLRAVQLHAPSRLGSHDLVWIAYALFHPDTPSSTWKSLELLKVGLSDHCITLLQSMARGNNLVAVLSGRPASSDGYYRATVAPQASIFAEPIRTWWQWLTSQTLLTVEGSLTVDVCDVTTEDVTLWDEWVAVIVPAYGLAWVQSSNIVHVEKREPTRSSLQSLRLTRLDFDLRDDARVVTSLLSVLGSTLHHLDIGRYCEHASAADLTLALAQCPSLQTLVVAHSGELWSGDQPVDDSPYLRELELCLSEEYASLRSFRLTEIPASLQVLRVSVFGWHGLYHTNLTAIKQVLTKPNRLCVFHWQQGLLMQSRSHEPTPYSVTCAVTTELLNEFEVPVGQRSYAVSPISSAGAAAFLSVLLAQQIGHPLACIDRGVARNILALASDCTPRVLVIDPAVDDLVEPAYSDTLPIAV